MSKPLSAGSTIETRCSRCNGVLNHTIVAMVGEKIVRVECDTCHGVHSFHPVKLPKEAGSVRAVQKKDVAPRKTKNDPEAAIRAEWEALLPEMDSAEAIQYDMNRVYREKNFIAHPHFGVGYVQLVIPPNKIDVLFKTGKKRLRCG